ncbi:restriction endonuclease FokI C-terminal domain-containing protein [Clostridium sp. Marseille-P2415]|uniref:restriction endonuclease FokI C-terminal domain-containing protein n=1 Tax=Clostridium sp. Marseille-P2415 TaxID=1805471 RepID=UPI001F3D41CA|nr:restriction endonuclease FokI C-terminal domain-containing protein [Clostridium sp. Marseille-P2415]
MPKEHGQEKGKHREEMTVADRTFGWVQEAYTLGNLKNVVSVFVPDSEINRILRMDKIPRLISEKDGRDEFIRELSGREISIPYTHLKGKGTPAGYTRSNAPCSGIIQAVLPGQRKEYQSDWPADSFLRWAVSIGFLHYDRKEDVCSLSVLGRRYADAPADSEEEVFVLKTAFLSYPPVCRVLSLLGEEGHLTKFEIGARLGFIGEAGFTSIPQYMILQGLLEAETREEKTKLLQDTEGTSDKYVRTICSWLIQMGWVNKVPKEVTAHIGCQTFTGTIPQSYQLTLKGRTVLKHVTGVSKFPRIPKRVMWDMLATKVADREYLRNRRTYIIKYLEGAYRSALQVKEYLKGVGMEEEAETILDDIRSLENIGLHVKKAGSTYRIMDEITGLLLPAVNHGPAPVKSEVSVCKDYLRSRLTHVDHKYLLLLDLGYDGTSDRDYEIQTAGLLTDELDFKGARLGDTRKPDVCVYYGEDGLILDNKAYGKGYSLPIKQADEMYRYIEENKERNEMLNPNKWWEIFDRRVVRYHFAFVSGAFTGGFKERLNNIRMRSGICGAAVNSMNLLLMAEELKSGRLGYKECFALFDCNDEIVL